ncbi:hypothetical protein NA57DRAFT_30863 [Rhizodiscina lignyota]|uniref:Elongation of fatty acids protein n=1 Tax=Rhizodiscina lignyota TaxID=1504668 RepID=A0A9P4MBL9_9PEZI|nr:hypothetical protein NA57DRAFT_30863 [Rhizodiscina lignyota]
MAGPSVSVHLPPLSLFKFPPDPAPPTIPPPHGDSRFASPFPIDAKLYNDLLSPYLPLTIAAIYATTVIIVNKINRERGFKPYWISTTRLFFVFVILHNVFLAIFSGLTFVAMIRALRHTWPSQREYERFGILWPGLRTQNGFAGAADALCKIQGPRGFGDAVTYNTTKGLWEVKNKIIQLGLNGLPDSTDVGRLWNEGLAFWGWFFYLSKFYEVVDTAIILVKGKKSSTLQMYHHAGAMLCMWAGIRYMSPPIWMFVFMNSLIHALMYVYYTLSALGVHVPRRVKKTLTTMQIAQFVLGFTFAAGHLFISYTIPSSVIYAGKYGFKAATAAAASAMSTAAADLAPPTATAVLGAWLKKLAFRAAGQEGLAENVRNSWGEVFGPEADYVQETLDRMTKKDEFQLISCIDTTGQSFAIWLNLIYLAPLTWLFLRFFFRSYNKRTSSSTAHSTHTRRISRSAIDAARGVDRELESLGRSAEDGVGEAVEEGQSVVDDAGDKAGEVKDEAEEKADEVKQEEEGQNVADNEGDKAGEVNDEAEEKADEVKQEEEENVSSPQDSGVLVDTDDNEEDEENENEAPQGQDNADKRDEEPKQEGLSTADPREEDASYADKVK